jgi:glycosyltransferase involved in cell wall biosynthesis/SAM-dependent methyltransferase
MNACTIVARNYMAQARVLAETFLQHHQSGRFITLVIDAREPLDDTAEAFEVVGPADIGVEESEFRRMAMIYDVMGLATAVKPWLLKRLLESEDTITYLDPDIQVFASLEAVPKLARKHSIVLTPRATEPQIHDRMESGEATFLLAGIYSPGFVALGPESHAFLDWWSERVSQNCLVPERGEFVEQRWVDFVPALFSHYIVRDPAYNVAWWNLTGRALRWTGQRYTVNGKRLRFFHFSGFDPSEPHLLSKHQGPFPRILLSEHPALAKICGEYAERLFKAGFSEMASQRYGFDALAGGMPIDRRMRRLYRQALLAAEDRKAPEPPNPFEPGQEDAFIEWLREPPDTRGEAAKIGRYLQAVYRERPDLQAAFPDLRWLNGDRFLGWVLAHGQEEESIPLELLPEPPVPARRSIRPTPDLLEGVNVAGYLRAEVGVGEAARHVVSAIERAGIPFAIVNYEQTPSRQAHPFGHRDSAPRHDVNLICVNADRLPEFAYDMGPGFFEGRYSIGLWWWEIGQFPERFHEAFDVVDEIWVGSDFVAEAVSRETSKPVRTLPLGVEARETKPIPRAALGLPEGFQFLFSFDFYSVFERKNPLGLIHAFKQAFEPEEGPTLVIKSINGDQRLVELERLRAAADRPDIVVLDKYVSAEEKNAMMAGCDCYVSLHRSEGFGLTMAEAMAYGKPVIATAYSGNLMFMNENNSYLVPYRSSRIPEGCEPYPAGIEWADPDLEAAAGMMRRVYEHPEEARERGDRAREDIREKHSPARTAAFVRRRLASIRESRAAAADVARTQTDELGGASARAARYLERGPSISWDAPSRLGPLGRGLRRFVRRALRPYTLRHAEFEAAVVEALAELDRAARQAALQAADAAAAGEAASDLASNVERRLAATQARELDRLRQLERLVHAFNSSLSATLRSHAGHLHALERQSEEHAADIASHLASIDAALEETKTLASELHEPPFVSDPESLRIRDSSGREALGYSGNSGSPADGTIYRSFEDVFRGSEDFIRERQRVYVSLVEGHEPVLDVGCGRGELLDLLAEANIEARGVDSDAGMVEHCRARGHDVELADANAYLRGEDGGSLGAIVAAQFIEHLDYEALLAFFQLSEEKLAPGGVFIAETVNPHSVAALRTFWVDPTHRSPIFPEVAVVLCRLHGFESAVILFPNGTGELERDRQREGEYAVVARKKTPATRRQAGTKNAASLRT